MALRVDAGPRGFHSSLDNGGKVCGLRAQVQRSASDARNVEKIVKQQRHVMHLAADDFMAPALLFLGCTGGL